jgi:sulfur relay (sulfurtransferase) DsrF/TusC family protein
MAFPLNIINTIKNVVYPITSRYISRATLVEGVMKNDDILLRCLFIGNSNLVEFFSERTFSERAKVLRCCRVWIRNLDKILTGNSGEFDICVAVIPKRNDDRFKEIYDYKCDMCVGQTIDLSRSIDEIKKNFHKTKRQISNSIISKSKLTYRISNDLKDFDHFYHDMFTPHIRKKHGGLLIEPYEDMKAFFQKGFILLVSYEGETVSGALCIIKGKTLVFRRTGVLNGDEKYIKLGAQNALYLFLIMYAKEMGLDHLDTMKSVSFLNDGVYQAKREWGATVYVDDESKLWIYFIIPKITDNVIKFFELNPAIVHSEDGLSGLVGFNGDSCLVNGSEKELNKKYYAPGINNLLVLTPESGEAMTIPLSGHG